MLHGTECGHINPVVPVGQSTYTSLAIQPPSLGVTRQSAEQSDPLARDSSFLKRVDRAKVLNHWQGRVGGCDVKLSGDDYISGASERITAAYVMYTSERFVDAVYLAGVAVECILRAYADESDEFEARHDLSRLMKAATLERFVGEKQRQTISAALGEVWSRWKNNYRYIPDPRLRKEFKRLELDRGIRGDALKENARVALENAMIVVNKGTFQWKKK